MHTSVRGPYDGRFEKLLMMMFEDHCSAVYKRGVNNNCPFSVVSSSLILEVSSPGPERWKLVSAKVILQLKASESWLCSSAS